MSQQSFASADYALKKKRTRREQFLKEMERIVPWARLGAAVAAVQVQVAALAGTVKNRLQKEIDHSRKQLAQIARPGLKAKPPEALLAGVVGKPTVEQITRWIDRQLDQVFPKVDDIVSEMHLVLTIKAVMRISDQRDRPFRHRDRPFRERDRPFR